MRLVLQSEAAECGLACLVMVADAHGLRLDLAQLRRRFSTSLKGTGLTALIRHADALGLAGRALRLELEELEMLRVPCILHWDLNHFVVLKSVRGRKVVILDPAGGERVVSLDEMSRHFTGVALELTPTVRFKADDQRRTIRIGDLTGAVIGLRRILLQLFVLAFALELFAISAPLFNQFVVDEVIVTADRDLLLVLAAGFALLTVTQTAISVLRSWLLMRLSIDVRLQWTTSLLSHLLRLPAAFFEKRHLGDIASRFGSIDNLQGTLTTAVVAAILDSVMAMLALGMALAYSPLLTAIVIVSVISYGLLRWLFYRPLFEANQERLVLAAREQTYFLETLRAVVPIKLAGLEAARTARWQSLQLDVYNRDVRTQKLGILFSTASTFVLGTSGLLVFSFGAIEVMESRLSLGMLLAFSSYAGTFSSRINALIAYAVDFKLLNLHAERVADIALEPAEERPEIETDVSRLAPRLEARNLAFRYAADEPWVLKDLSLSVGVGESVAIVGPSGCGKTTLVKILLGLLVPDEGEVMVGGVSARQLGLPAYRSLIGAVLQDDALFAGSIAENIAFFEPGIAQERIEECARLAAIHDDIVRMPMGYQTLVGDLGSTLSGGQRQRVMLARALCRNPRILILDEATSHLDIFNERRLIRALAELGITRILVSHRRETLEGVTRTIVLSAAEGDDDAAAASEKKAVTK